MRFTRAQKIILGMLVFCVGGMGSLIFFDAVSPEHGPHAYHLTFFDNHGHAHSPLPPVVEAKALRIARVIAAQIGSQPHLTMHSAVSPGLSQFFHSGMNLGFLLTKIPLNLSNYSAISASLQPDTPSGQSYWPAPPDKPPSRM